MQRSESNPDMDPPGRLQAAAHQHAAYRLAPSRLTAVPLNTLFYVNKKMG